MPILSSIKNLLSRGNNTASSFRAIFSPPARKDEALAQLMRSWEAATTDAQTLGWCGDNNITSYTLAHNLPTIRRRCREASKNDAYVRRALALYINNIIGSKGIKLSIDAQGSNGKTDMQLSDKLERAFRLWAETPAYCDAEGKKTITQILQLAVRLWKLEGECFIHIAHSGLNPFGTQLKVYRADAVALDINEDSDKRKIANGIELDAYGRPRAYYIRSLLSYDGTFMGDAVRVPARQILHLYEEEEAGQLRGIPVFAAVLKDLRLAHGYDLAELIAARVDASRVGTWQQQDSGDPSQIADVTDYGFTQSTEPGEDRISPLGWTYHADAPSRPNSGYGQFKKDILRRIASALSLSYNTLANDLEGVSYSSIRSGTLEDRQQFMVMQQIVIDCILRPLFRRKDGWLDTFLQQPRAAAFGLKADNLAQLETADSWLPRRWDWVDPQSEAAAKEIQVAHHWTTDSDIASEGGKDWFDNVETARQEAEWLKQLGVNNNGE